MCLLPIRASLPEDGGRPILDPEGELKLPCGKCHVCISKRGLEWATRVRHEISQHDENCFLTLTYSDENLCSQFTVKKHFQKFMKRLRKNNPDQKISYMTSYEYGTKTFRPHMHAIIFGYTPPNQTFERCTPSGSKLYVSPEIDKLWKKGFHSIGEANEKTAYYIATYALKGKSREITHSETGESIEIRDSMTCSKRPAIGQNFLYENAVQLVDSEKPLPRFYVKRLKQYSEISEISEALRTKSEQKIFEGMKHLPTTLYDTYYERIMNNLKTRGDLEAYAKFIIDTQKMDSENTGLRSEDLDPKEAQRREFFEAQLKHNRDTFVATNHKSKEIL